ncbi:MAG: ORF6N domain-containing protein, partial [Pedobacter sp.]
MTAKQTLSIIPEDILLNKIYEIRGHKVMLDSDLAELYGV